MSPTFLQVQMKRWRVISLSLCFSKLQMTDLVQENALLKGKIVTLNETVNSTELESKASRETIMRLVSEVGKEQKVATRFTSEIDNLRLVCFPACIIR